MATYKLGININPKAGLGEAFDYNELFYVAERADKAGLEFLAVPDVVSKPVPRFDSMCYSAALAVKTKRIKIGTDVVVLPLRHPVELARMVATVDIISEGRFIFGAGIGWLPKEHEDLGSPFMQRAGRSDEMLEIMKRLWTEPSVTYNGKYYKLRDVIMDPKPMTKPHPLIWIGGASEAAMRRAAKYGDGLGAYVWGVDDIGKFINRQKEILKEHGRDLSKFSINVRIDTNINPDKNKAIEEGEKAWKAVRDAIEGGGVKTGAHDLSQVLKDTGDSFADLKVKRAAYGPPEEVVEKVKELHALGADMVVLYLHTTSLKTQWERIEKSVLPKLL